MEEEESQMTRARQKQDQSREMKLQAERDKDIKGGPKVVDQKFKALEYLLSQSKLYSTIMLSQMQEQDKSDEARDAKVKKKADKKQDQADKAAQVDQTTATRRSGNAKPAPKTPPKLKRAPSAPKKSEKISDYMSREQVEAKAGKTSIAEALAEEVGDDEDGVKAGEIGMQDLKSAKQPDLVTGGLMRTYQLEGLEWLKSLYENGLNGILADEMGLGKTIQTISFLAFLREQGVYGPFLIAAPLSTTSNWVAEFKKWTPDIPVVLYHGSKQEREELRRKKLKNPGSETFPVICTSYEICMNDRKHLAHFGWKFVIIDEGHRIKNLNCRLIQELQSYQSANRLLITGTPLQNNLTELWSLLHFLMPSVFDKLESFESWFDFSALKEKGGHEQILSQERRTSLVSSLHAILKPFLLRRVKADVEHSLPKKREYVLYAPMTTSQKELYQEILQGNSRAYLEDKAFEAMSGATTPARSSNSRKRKATLSSAEKLPRKSTRSSRASSPGSVGSRLRTSNKNHNYEEVSDSKYFQDLESGAATEDDDNDNTSNEAEPDSSAQEALDRAQTLALAKRQIGAKKLQNPVMQLRLCCNSPHNFYYPFTAEDESDVDDTLVSESGKMLLLDRLLPELISKGHKVLIFSQFKSQLDLLQTYCEALRAWPVCRIDGSIPQSERQEQILAFNEPASDTNIFLLSTRAGGQGINLASADTVLLFDSDWNPQQDLQAQDRAHRIGQTRPVIVYRFATKGTIESVLLEKADSKRRLEKLVIKKGGFRSMMQRDAAGGGDEISELQKLLATDDGERFDVGDDDASRGQKVLSDAELQVLTDRSPEAFERAERGEGAIGDRFKTVVTKSDGGGLLEQMSK